MSLDHSSVFSSKAKIAVVSCLPEEIDRMQQRANSEGIVARVIRGHRCRNIRSLLQEWAAALQFPYYFGENLDAFDECVADLSWLPSNKYLWIVTDADGVSFRVPRAFRSVVDGVISSTECQDGDRRFDVRLILQAEAARAGHLVEFLGGPR